MKIKIIANPKKEWAKAAALKARAMLREHKYEIIRGSGADVTICIGGDGTILHANHKNRLEGIVLGIGSKTSYICQLRGDNWEEKLIPLIESKKIVKIQTLEAQLQNKTIFAINDVVIHASNYRVLILSVKIDEKTHTFESDGLVVSSAVGSSAYAYSAGGEKLRPIEKRLSVVPVCAYKRAFKPETLDENAEVEVTTGNNCALICDGILVRYLQKDASVKIKKGKDITFYEGVGNDG